MRSRFWFALGIAAMGMLSSCDFWQNLIGEKSITKATLNLTLQDAWTKEPIPRATCTDSTGGIFHMTDASGQVRIENFSTGQYKLLCQVDGYHDGISVIDLHKNSNPITVTLVRLGGVEHWYPREPDREIDFYLSQGNFLVPGFQEFRSTLTDTTGLFLYKWTSAKHPDLNRNWTSRAAHRNYFRARLESLDAESEDDTITLSVRAKFPGHPEYDIHSVSAQAKWKRNKPPTLSVSTSNRGRAKVGCPTLGDPWFTLRYFAQDEEPGICQVTVSSTDSTSSIGIYSRTQPCKGDDWAIIPLRNSFAGIKNVEVLKQSTYSNRILISATDDNGQTKDTTITLITNPHIPPAVSISKLSTPPIIYEGKSIAFKFDSHAFSALEVLEVDWGDGLKPIYSFSDGNSVDSATQVYSHTYEKAGTYFVSAKIYDACKDSSTYQLTAPTIITKNSLPVLLVGTPAEELFGQKIQYSLDITAKDTDLESGTDSLQLVLDWGDLDLDTIPNIRSTLNLRPTHTYMTPPLDTVKKVHHLRITLTDANGGVQSRVYEIKPSSP